MVTLPTSDIIKTEGVIQKEPTQYSTSLIKTSTETVYSIANAIKREDSIPSQPSPTPTSRPPSIVSNADVKRELLDDNSQMSAASDHSSIKQDSIKEDTILSDPETAARIAQETALEIKRKINIISLQNAIQYMTLLLIAHYF